MDNASYILASKQMSSVRNLEVTSNNVANLNTEGFKADNVIFKQYMHRDARDKTSMTAPISTLVDFTEGSVKTSGRALDVAIAGPGFFMVRTPLGDRYTRAGHFSVDKNNMLVTSQGYKVLSSDGQYTSFEDGDADPIIGDDGTVFVGADERGQIGVVEFDDVRKLRKLGNGLFTSEVAGKTPEESRVVQGALEASNVNAVAEIALLAQIQKEVAETTHFINENYSLQRHAFKTYSKVGG